jgi:hypothetical protein
MFMRALLLECRARVPNLVEPLGDFEVGEHSRRAAEPAAAARAPLAAAAAAAEPRRRLGAAAELHVVVAVGVVAVVVLACRAATVPRRGETGGRARAAVSMRRGMASIDGRASATPSNAPTHLKENAPRGAFHAPRVCAPRGRFFFRASAVFVCNGRVRIYCRSWYLSKIVKMLWSQVAHLAMV